MLSVIKLSCLYPVQNQEREIFQRQPGMHAIKHVNNGAGVWVQEEATTL